MQFLPQTWRSVARDGDGDGQTNPQDIDDSALSAAVYLCGVGGSVADRAGMSRAAFRYNRSDYYVALVLSYEAGYRTGVFTLPSPPPPAAAAERSKTKSTRAATQRAARKAARTAVRTAKPRTTAPKTVSVPRPKVRPTSPATPVTPTRPTSPARPSSTPKPSPAPRPTPTTRPTPATKPSAPKLVSVTGTWTQCAATFCLGGKALDLGAGNRGAAAGDDLDGDGRVETYAEEFAGLVGQQVTVSAERGATGLVVYLIAGSDFRNADGSLAG